MKRVPEREAAKAAGERFYWTGKPCRNGHITKRYTGSGNCSACAIKRTITSAAKRPQHPNRIAARETGETHYSTGVPCKHGHDRRLASNGVCVDCDRERQRRYHVSRPGLEAKWARERRAKDPSGHRKSSTKWSKKNPERVAEIRKRMFARDPEGFRKKAVVATNRRRVQVTQNGGRFTVADIEALHDKQGGKCAACQKQTKLEIDHIVAVANGGSNDPSNLQLLCSKCNKSKGKKDQVTWASDRGHFLS